MSDYPEKETMNSQPDDTAGKSYRPPNDPYWSEQDARRAQEHNQQTPEGYNRQWGAAPPPHYQQPPYNPGYRQPGQQNNAYHYGSNWEQPGRSNQYEWNFHDYEQMGAQKEPGKKKKNRGLMIFAISLLCVLTVTLVSMSVLSLSDSLSSEDMPQEPAVPSGDAPQDPGIQQPSGGGDAQVELSKKPASVSEDTSRLENEKLSIPEVAQRLLPSVVSVENYQQGHFYEPISLGSGIIMSEDGYIITNQHVVEDAAAIKVTLNSGSPYEAKLIGSDKRTDLAVIKIEPEEKLIPAEFGDSSQMQVGETVVAIGNPASMELAGSVTQGIISAMNRQVSAGAYSMNFIQTDAAINPGNSGGALANEYGQVIGINSAKVSRTGFEGIGFAIPMSEAKPVIDDLIANGRVTGRVKLGITAQEVDEVDERRGNVPRGLRVVTIDPDSDMLTQGVQEMDIITHIDGMRVYTFDDLRDILGERKVGEKVRLTLFRQSVSGQGQSFDVQITLIEDVG